eukprot:756911-Hanusia_phi.AAC.2
MEERGEEGQRKEQWGRQKSCMTSRGDKGGGRGGGGRRGGGRGGGGRGGGDRGGGDRGGGEVFSRTAGGGRQVQVGQPLGQPRLSLCRPLQGLQLPGQTLRDVFLCGGEAQETGGLKQRRFHRVQHEAACTVIQRRKEEEGGGGARGDQGY